MALSHYFPVLSLWYSVIFGKAPGIRHPCSASLCAFGGCGMSTVLLHTLYPLVSCRQHLLSRLFHHRRYCSACRFLPNHSAHNQCLLQYIWSQMLQPYYGGHLWKKLFLHLTYHLRLTGVFLPSVLCGILKSGSLQVLQASACLPA